MNIFAFIVLAAGTVLPVRAETFDCYYRKSNTRFGVIVVEGNKADLLLWGDLSDSYKNLDVKRSGKRIIIDYPFEILPYYPAAPFVSPIILKKRFLSHKYNYYFIHENTRPEICYQTQ